MKPELADECADINNCTGCRTKCIQLSVLDSWLVADINEAEKLIRAMAQIRAYVRTLPASERQTRMLDDLAACIDVLGIDMHHLENRLQQCRRKMDIRDKKHECE